MCSELIDVRTKVTRETDAWLESFSRASGKDRSEILRDVLHQIAIEKISEISIAHDVLKAKGLVGA